MTTMIRRLCREAVIFMLTGLVLAGLGSFIYLRHNAVLEVETTMDAIKKAKTTQEVHPPLPTVNQILRDPKFRSLSTEAQASILSYLDPKYAALAPADQQSVLAHLDTLKPVPLDLSEFGGKPVPDWAEGLTAPGARAISPPATKPEDQWGIVREDVNYQSLAETSAVYGLFGFAGGFVVWLFYRLVHFAVKG